MLLRGHCDILVYLSHSYAHTQGVAILFDVVRGGMPKLLCSWMLANGPLYPKHTQIPQCPLSSILENELVMGTLDDSILHSKKSPHHRVRFCLGVEYYSLFISRCTFLEVSSISGGGVVSSLSYLQLALFLVSFNTKTHSNLRDYQDWFKSLL